MQDSNNLSELMIEMILRDQLFRNQNKLRCNEPSFVGHIMKTIYVSASSQYSKPKIYVLVAK